MIHGPYNIKLLLDTIQKLDNIKETAEDKDTIHCIKLILTNHSSVHVSVTVEPGLKPSVINVGSFTEKMTLRQVLLKILQFCLS